MTDTRRGRSNEQGQVQQLGLVATPTVETRMEERRQRLSQAYEEIQTMEADFIALKQEADRRQSRIRELEMMVGFLDQRIKDLDADRLTYARQAVSLARAMTSIATAARSIGELCEDAVALAADAEAVEQEMPGALVGAPVEEKGQQPAAQGRGGTS